ncbi:LLM class flavin-dependent oxidoreductase [Xylophilus sp.]|uniref:LLM class flavin-dependent oxidoreductase n=1 Tax=Xylophilus sp. TaxID=2653893 RepID=UPI0013BA15FC|nr:LLM class flavin-dependent oxidoreductase [Xylophilus sp.]KAF1050119.1 MAG: Alkanesulfonate monooxygenase [Xylophilus sp.]
MTAATPRARPRFYWYTPTRGDSRLLIESGRGRRPGLLRQAGIDYVRQLAGVAEAAGLEGIMLPTGVATEDGGLLAAALVNDTRRLRFMVSFRAGPELPTHFAQRIATLQQLSGERIQVCLFNGSEEEQRSYGDFTDHDVAYERAGEFIAIARALWRGEPVQHASRHYLVDCRTAGGLPAAVGPTPRIHAFGISAGADALVARHADVHMLWGWPPALIRERVARTRALAAEAGRSIDLGLRLSVIARETEAEAWAEAQRLLDALPAGVIDQAQRELARWQSTAMARMQALHGHGRIRGLRELELHFNLWLGSALVGGMASFVGSYAQVAERIAEYANIGFGTFVLSGYPNLEALNRVGEHVLPRIA